ncbi:MULTISPECIES: hypothetical protein [Bradyrhizobium]|uniref:Leucine-rich repeat domain-containing protein n=1 Tax=Bradyrhizobium yuanmingense TaxID=108015 RepID=A0A1C3XH94_9BRAD|nr:MULTISPECIES: hypothetical protein [Bradyrhizobium]TWI18307.1 hypothetical protein IQ15_07196 [Bradyrhizobium yuanmingense]UWU93704.1 hypothetical protein N2604_07525 [Bradyrhizobium sp. CB1015]SCB51623.1 hypothetical protein GA0061099_102024 [Bradyrhizobium yuanmingense]
MDPFEAGPILRGDGISSNEQEGQENEAGAQWDGVLTGYDVADSAHAEDDQDQTVENWAAERDVGPLEDREEALTRLNLSEFNQHLDLESLSLTSLPRFSTDLRRIDVPFNRLTRLPHTLPATLESLNVGHNQLTNLPTLPAVLAYLDASNNRLANLPDAILPRFSFSMSATISCRICRRSSLPRSRGSALVATANQVTRGAPTRARIPPS